MIPLDSMSKGIKAWVSSKVPKSLTSNSSLEVETGVSAYMDVALIPALLNRRSIWVILLRKLAIDSEELISSSKVSMPMDVRWREILESERAVARTWWPLRANS